MTTKPGWKMPTVPKCESCGVDVEAVAYHDGDGISFFWDEWCGKCSSETGAPEDDERFHEWPFVNDIATVADLEAAGFRVE